MTNKSFDPEFFFRIACSFESSLVIVALIFGWFADINPFASLHFSEDELAEGIIATLPLILLFYLIQQLPFPAIKKIRELLISTLGPSLNKQHWTDLLILAVVIGFSEEVLFRGFLQPWLENTWNPVTGLVISNLFFALVHAVTPLYAFLAFLIGLYLGIFLEIEGEPKLLIPIIIHSLYDYIAFLIVLRNYRSYL